MIPLEKPTSLEHPILDQTRPLDAQCLVVTRHCGFTEALGGEDLAACQLLDLI